MYIETLNLVKAGIFCVDAMYSGEYDACDVTLSVYPHRASLKNIPVHGGNRTYDLWNTSPMLCQLSYVFNINACILKKLTHIHTQKEWKFNLSFPPVSAVFE